MRLTKRKSSETKRSLDDKKYCGQEKQVECKELQEDSHQLGQFLSLMASDAQCRQMEINEYRQKACKLLPFMLPK